MTKIESIKNIIAAANQSDRFIVFVPVGEISAESLGNWNPETPFYDGEPNQFTVCEENTDGRSFSVGGVEWTCDRIDSEDGRGHFTSDATRTLAE